MLAPDREAEAYPPIFRELGHTGIALWRAAYPDLSCSGGLVVASARDRSDLERFARRTQGHEMLDAGKLAHIEPEEVFKKVDVGKVIITHIHPDLDDKEEEILELGNKYTRNVVVAYDGLEVEL